MYQYYDATNKDIIAVWTSYLSSINDWKELVRDKVPKEIDCGRVYELANPINRPSESFAIADMRGIAASKPHCHTNGETEIYIVLEGSGQINLDGDERSLNQGDVVVTPPDTVHYITQANQLVLAVINIPPFKPNNVVYSE